MTDSVTIPDLSGVATKELVENIGSGRFTASYINWSRTMNLLRKNAPGWFCETVFNADGDLVHKAPVGGYLLMRYRHVSGFATPEVPQAIMDHRNNAISYDKITARDVTDTQRRGACLVAAMQFGLAHELWAKMPLESGYGEASSSEAPSSASKKPVVAVSPTKPSKTPKTLEGDFRKAAAAKGLCEEAVDFLTQKVSGDYEVGIKTLGTKDKSWVEAENAKFQESY